ncbi:hypothetical protein B0T11DRAFT_284201 [Plectosphaerella cucumerina]|uniref:LysM domain-containing protein n=1 Tax=Plectosphaerella cucumerina TaxID=40658 RepID=A0A8K0T8N2_9PEZI|nr:hypothetical protein B0T11DRAFT_284201 [Plectosphaerella cucumerina]
MRLSSACFSVLVGWTSWVHAQQFLLLKQSYDAMGLSDECTTVLNTELEKCHSLLFQHTDRTTGTIIKVLPREELDLICEPMCREELSALRRGIQETCTSSSDLIRHSGFELPAFYFADKFAYTYDMNCYRHRSSGRFCDEVFSDWRSGKTKFNQCDDCYLGPLAYQISSPIGVSNFSVSHFEDVMASCPDSNYEVQVAKTYKVEMPVAPKEDTRNCTRWYTMKNGDTCVGISLSQNSSTVKLIQNNGMDVNCGSMPDEGTELCLQEPCITHMIRPGETCATISHKYGISTKQFRALNTMIDETCSNIDRWEGYIACVGPTSSLVAGPAQLRLQSDMQKPQAITPRKPLAPGSSEKCTLFVNGRSQKDPDLVAQRQQVPPMEGEDKLFSSFNRCGHVTNYNGVSIREFWRLNPSLDKNKCFLEEKYSYCLAEEGGQQPDPEEGWNPRWGLRWG